MKKYNKKSPYETLKDKTLSAALLNFFTIQFPNIGELSLRALVSGIEPLVEKYYPRGEHLKMGQIVWSAVYETEVSSQGKPMSKTKTIPVIVDAVTNKDIENIINKKKRRDVRKEVAVRLFNQAYDQHGVFTHIDVASIMNMSPATIGKYIKEHELENNVSVPRRGTIHDMGPTLTHKRDICYKYIIQGKSVEDVCKETKHSPEAVSRYIEDYRRVEMCKNEGMTIEQTKVATKMSLSLIKEYWKLIEKHNDLTKSGSGIL